MLIAIYIILLQIFCGIAFCAGVDDISFLDPPLRAGRNTNLAEVDSSDIFKYNHVETWVHPKLLKIWDSSDIDGRIHDEFMELVDPRPLPKFNNVPYDCVYGPLPQFIGATLLSARRLSENSDSPIAIEFGNGGGGNFWKLALTGHHVYVNDLNPANIAQTIEYAKSFDVQEGEEFFDEDEKMILFKDLITPDIGDACQFLERHSAQEGQVNMIVAQNLLHFFPPKKLNIFAEMVQKILNPGGEIHVLVQSFLTGSGVTCYAENKLNQHPFPGYLLQERSPSSKTIVTRQGDIGDPEIVYEYLSGTSIPIKTSDHYLDPEVLSRVFKEHGLEVFETDTLDAQCVRKVARENFPDIDPFVHFVIRARKPFR